jgi:hypothetical protein
LYGGWSKNSSARFCDGFHSSQTDVWSWVVMQEKDNLHHFEWSGLLHLALGSLQRSSTCLRTDYCSFFCNVSWNHPPRCQGQAWTAAAWSIMKADVPLISHNSSRIQFYFYQSKHFSYSWEYLQLVTIENCMTAVRWASLSDAISKTDYNRDISWKILELIALFSNFLPRKNIWGNIFWVALICCGTFCSLITSNSVNFILSTCSNAFVKLIKAIGVFKLYSLFSFCDMFYISIHGQPFPSPLYSFINKYGII